MQISEPVVACVSDLAFKFTGDALNSRHSEFSVSNALSLDSNSDLYYILSILYHHTEREEGKLPRIIFSIWIIPATRAFIFWILYRFREKRKVGGPESGERADRKES